MCVCIILLKQIATPLWLDIGGMIMSTPHVRVHKSLIYAIIYYLMHTYKICRIKMKSLYFCNGWIELLTL